MLGSNVYQILTFRNQHTYSHKHCLCIEFTYKKKENAFYKETRLDDSCQWMEIAFIHALKRICVFFVPNLFSNARKFDYTMQKFRFYRILLCKRNGTNRVTQWRVRSSSTN